MTAYTQEDGETTAWLPDTEAKMVLSHEGRPVYRKVFYLLVTGGMLYLLVVFLTY